MNDLKGGQFASAGGGQFAPADVVQIDRQGVVSLGRRRLVFLSGLSKPDFKIRRFHMRFHSVWSGWGRMSLPNRLANDIPHFAKMYIRGE